MVEIVLKKNARVRYTTIQNWSNNVYNLVTKRAVAHEGATMEWVDGNIGSRSPRSTRLFTWLVSTLRVRPCPSHSRVRSAPGHRFEDGSHCAEHLLDHVSKSVARTAAVAHTAAWFRCVRALSTPSPPWSVTHCWVDTISRSDTYPYVDVREDDVTMGHKATVSRVSEDQLFYLMQRGLSEEEAMAMIVRGFVEPIARELPMEYALELNRLIELQMEGSVG